MRHGGAVRTRPAGPGYACTSRAHVRNARTEFEYQHGKRRGALRVHVTCIPGAHARRTRAEQSINVC